MELPTCLSVQFSSAISVQITSAADTSIRASRWTHTFGNRITPEDAYRFARDRAVVTASDVQAQLKRPLDFLVVADHAEFMGVGSALEANDSYLLGTSAGRGMWRRLSRLVSTDAKSVCIPSVLVVCSAAEDKSRVSSCLRPVSHGKVGVTVAKACDAGR